MKIMPILFFSLALLFLACNGRSKNGEETDARTHLQRETVRTGVPVQVAVVRKGVLQKRITIYGKLQPKQVTALGSQFAGRIVALSLSEGDRVSKGQVVATIRSPKAEALQQAEPSSAASLRGEVLPIPVRAPFSGIVTRKSHYTGDVVSAGEPILEIQNDSVFYLWGQLPAVYLPEVKIGQELKVTFPDLPDESFIAKIEAINSTVDSRTQMAQIRATLTNRRHLLKADLFARIEITVKSLPDALLVPRSALLSRPDGSFVFLVKNGQAYLQAVEPGLGNAAVFVIRSGLAAGDSVVVLGNFELQDEMAVEVMP